MGLAVRGHHRMCEESYLRVQTADDAIESNESTGRRPCARVDVPRHAPSKPRRSNPQLNKALHERRISCSQPLRHGIDTWAGRVQRRFHRQGQLKELNQLNDEPLPVRDLSAATRNVMAERRSLLRGGPDSESSFPDKRQAAPLTAKISIRPVMRNAGNGHRRMTSIASLVGKLGSVNGSAGATANPAPVSMRSLVAFVTLRYFRRANKCSRFGRRRPAS